MSYRVVLTRKAEATLDSLDYGVQEYVDKQLKRLSDTPGMGRPAASPPFPPGGMIYEFDYHFEDEWHHISICYLYAQNEMDLVILAIGHIHYETNLDWSPGDGL